MKSTVSNTLTSLSDLLIQLTNKEYTAPVGALSNATIGQHTRHIIELFQCLLTQYNTGIVNYDLRKRNSDIENDTNYAIACIKSIVKELDLPDKNIVLQSQLKDDLLSIDSTYYRELYYNLEHCIHHQALIKVGLVDLKHIYTENEFGVAPSTIKYRTECAQ